MQQIWGQLERDVTRAHVYAPDLVPVFRRVTPDATAFWEA